VGVLAHKQPVLEKYLRSIVEEGDSCELRSSCTLTSISEDENWVYATYDDASGREKRIRAKFLAAADGKTGFVRKMYLEPKGIRLDRAEQYVQFSRCRLRFLVNSQLELSSEPNMKRHGLH
jgi:2-polyprenyl-6-methoxyphenol hydroxylase-like FAD-dependent oxidoreductase